MCDNNPRAKHNENHKLSVLESALHSALNSSFREPENVYLDSNILGWDSL